MLNPEYITIVLDGAEWHGWLSVSISAAINEAARSFELVTSEPPGAFVGPPGTAIQIYASTTPTARGDLVLDGYVNVYKPDLSTEDHQVTLSGRGKGQDCVDCSAVHPKGYKKNATPVEFAQELDHFGVGIVADLPLDKVESQQIAQGETVMSVLERYIRPQGMTPMGEADGSIHVTNAKAAKRHANGFIEGKNIKVINAELSDDKRHSEHTVKGQRREGTTPDDLRIKESAKDYGVKRYRPKILVMETDATKALAKKRADHEAARSQGFSVKATVETQGWRDDAGKIFSPNHYIYTHSPSAKIDGDMLIEKVTLKQDNGGGSIATADLVNGKAYGGDGGPSKSNEAWG